MVNFFYILVNMRLIFFLFIILNCPNLSGQSFSSDKILSIVKTLSSDSMEGREIGSRGSLKAQTFLIKHFRDLNLKSFARYHDYKQPFKTIGANGDNLVGYIKGLKFPDKYILISAHYDHVGVKKGSVYNGADDNASGVGGMLGILSYFNENPPNHSIIFAAFDGEEINLKGSRFFVKNLPVSNIILNINMDMISRSDKHELYVSGTYHYPNLKNYILPSDKINVKMGHDNPKVDMEDWTSSSDHAAFHEAKIPFLYFGVEDHQDYHKPTDDFERIDPEFYKNCIQYITEICDRIDDGLN
jgi:hypothetical protein